MVVCLGRWQKNTTDNKKCGMLIKYNSKILDALGRASRKPLKSVSKEIQGINEICMQTICGDWGPDRILILLLIFGFFLLVLLLFPRGLVSRHRYSFHSKRIRGHFRWLGENREELTEIEQMRKNRANFPMVRLVFFFYSYQHVPSKDTKLYSVQK